MHDVAGVYILEAPYHIDRIYRYYIPPELSERVVPGTIVEVPFGNGNRRMTGAVYEITDAADTEELKPIMSAADVFPPYLDGDSLRLCSFLKTHTLCTFGEAVRCVLPSGAISKMSEYYSAARTLSEDEIEKALASMSEKAMFVYTAISGTRKMSKDTLRSKFGEDVSAVLGQLIRRELIKKHDELKGGEHVVRVTHVFATDNAQVSLRSERQLAVLGYVKEHAGCTLEELCDSLSLERATVRATLSALEKKQLVRCESERVLKSPLCAEAINSTELSMYSKPFELSDEQGAACEKLCELCDSHAPRAALLHGVTGSGKTNVILRVIDRVLESGRGVIMLVPEIALTPQTLSRFACRYGERIAVIHSALSSSERFDAWRRIKSGDADVVIGTRSAIFAPVKNLGLIVIDEEHEHTYKSDTDPKYLAHDVASFRCGESSATLILASATPSVTSYYKAVTGRYTLVELKRRFGNAALPRVEVADMRAELKSGNSSPLSRALISRISDDLENRRQTILFINRRGYNSTISCRVCGEAIKCPHCSVTLTYHTKSGHTIPRDSEAGEGYLELRRRNGYLRCHMCGYKSELPDKCPECGETHFLFCGLGTQLAENELHRLFPSARIVRMDYDTTRTKSAHEKLLSSFRDGETDILLGTQMVTKGHDFPRVSTVGILNADSSMFLDDFRAGERTFSMLTQVIGRAGRADSQGVSFIQTFNPESDIIALAGVQDYKTFYSREIRLREALTFPPFCDIAVLTLASADEARLSHAAVIMGEKIRQHIREDFTDVKAVIYGPFEAPVYKVQNVCRMRFVIKCRLTRRTREFISSLLCDFSRNGKNSRSASPVRVTADLNPTAL